MSVFEEVFTTRVTKRVEEKCQEDASVSAFDGVFARRGRWPRRGWSAVASGRGDSDQHGENIGSELPRGDTNDLETVMENPLESNEAAVHEIQDHAALTIKEGAQFVVKNTFLTTEGDEFDSLKGFLQERHFNSCPAGLFNQEEICEDDVEAAAAATAKELVFKTSSTMADFAQEESFKGVMPPRACSWNTASTFMELERLQSIDELSAEVDFLPAVSGTMLQAPPPCAPPLCAPPPCEQYHNVTQQNDTQSSAELRLQNLRMKGSDIQQQLSQDVLHDAAIHVPQQTIQINSAPVGQLQTNMWVPSVGDCRASFPEIPPTLLISNALHPPLSVPVPPPMGVAPMAAGVLRLSEAIAPPELGSRELPSIGSMLHHSGGCRPCTFFHTRGCENKQDCQFCHLCGPSEKKKRLRALKRAQRQAELATPGSTSDGTAACWQAGEADMDADMIVE